MQQSHNKPKFSLSLNAQRWDLIKPPFYVYTPELPSLWTFHSKWQTNGEPWWLWIPFFQRRITSCRCSRAVYTRWIPTVFLYWFSCADDQQKIFYNSYSFPTWGSHKAFILYVFQWNTGSWLLLMMLPLCLSDYCLDPQTRRLFLDG